MIGDANLTNDMFQQARHDNDLAVSLAKYLIQSLENRSHAEQFAHDLGMPGYFHMYKN
jgi:threonine aldolase